MMRMMMKRGGGVGAARLMMMAGAVMCAGAGVARGQVNPNFNEAAPAVTEKCGELGTFPVDPVRLVKGEERKGDAALFVDREGYRYEFVDEGSRAEFLRMPGAYEIQMGGACGRMGELAGRGSVGRYAVHEGRIYLFASDGCRSGFLKSPGEYLLGEDARPTATAEEREEGKRLLGRVIGAMGGEAAVDGVKSVWMFEETKPADGAATGHHTVTTATVLPDVRVVRQTWDEYWYRTVDRAEGGVFVGSSGAEMMATVQRRALRREFLALPLLMVRERGSEGFVAAGRGEEVVDGKRVRKVELWSDGFALTLLVDEGSGRVVASRHRGRGPSARVGEIERVYSDEREAGGVRLMCAWEGKFNGEATEGLSVRLKEVRVNGEMEEGLLSLE